MTKVSSMPDHGPGKLIVDVKAASVVRGSRLSLDQVSFKLTSHTLTAVIGPNGAGKSTLLHAIVGLLPLSNGSIVINGNEASRGHQNIAYVLQGTAIPSNLPMSVREVVTMGRYHSLGFFRRQRPKDRAIVADAMERLEVSHLASRQVMELSGGQRQRVYVAQGLAQQAPLLLLDEPVTGLDVVSRQRILAVVQEERAAGVAVVMTTHDLAEAASADQVVLLANKLVAAGPPEEVLRSETIGEAFGQRLVRLGSNVLMMDASHHHGSTH